MERKLLRKRTQNDRSIIETMANDQPEYSTDTLLTWACLMKNVMYDRHRKYSNRCMYKVSRKMGISDTRLPKVARESSWRSRRGVENSRIGPRKTRRSHTAEYQVHDDERGGKKKRT